MLKLGWIPKPHGLRWLEVKSESGLFVFELCSGPRFWDLYVIQVRFRFRLWGPKFNFSTPHMFLFFYLLSCQKNFCRERIIQGQRKQRIQCLPKNAAHSEQERKKKQHEEKRRNYKIHCQARKKYQLLDGGATFRLKKMHFKELQKVLESLSRKKPASSMKSWHTLKTEVSIPLWISRFLDFLRAWIKSTFKAPSMSLEALRPFAVRANDSRSNVKGEITGLSSFKEFQTSSELV